MDKVSPSSNDSFHFQCRVNVVALVSTDGISTMKRSLRGTKANAKHFQSKCKLVASAYIAIVSCRAAYQYGVKLKAGRQTRKAGGGSGKSKDDSKKLDREWNQISKVKQRKCLCIDVNSAHVADDHKAKGWRRHQSGRGGEAG